MCKWATNCSTDQVQVNSSTWYPITSPESPGWTPTTDSEFTVSLHRAKPGKKTSPCHVWKKGALGDSAQSPKLYAPPYCWNHWWTANWVAEASPYSKQWRKQSFRAFLAWANDHHQDGHIPAMGMLQRPSVIQTQTVDPPLVTTASSMAPESRKNTPEQTPQYISKLDLLKSERENYLWRTNGITGICLRRYLGLRLLL